MISAQPRPPQKSLLVSMANDQSFTSTTTLGNLPGMSFAVSSGETWHLEIKTVATTGSGGFKIDLSTPSKTVVGATLKVWNPGAAQQTWYYDQVAFATAISAANAFGAELSWDAVVTFSASGTVQVQGAQNSSDAAASTFKAGQTWMRATRIS